jgi:hypothetical protein
MSEAWERDPFLVIHRVGPAEYSIAGKYNPASIKDQMVRAVALVDRAYYYRLIENPKKLLVVGAGVAGASAAFRACTHRINTTLMEAKEVPFERQRNSSRIVDPTEFDWPAPHWRDGSMPGLPLTFDRGPADALAARWQEEYDIRARTDNYLTIWPRTRFIRSLAQADGRSAVLFEQDEGKGSIRKWEEFDFVLNCTGPVEEQLSIPNSRHAAYAFWADDKLEAPGFGMPRPMHEPRILISGGGDGALQDFLRIALPGKTARDIYEALIPSPELRAEIELRLFAAEDAFRRAWVWTEDEFLDCQVLQKLHEEHKAAAAYAAAKTTATLPDTGRLKNVTLAHACNHFSVCYAFNHFLALLVNQLSGDRHFVEKRRLRKVDSADPARHTCQSHPAYCWEYPHIASFWESTCGRSPAEIDRHAEYDIVVIRHGPKANTPRLARQILPYSSVWTKP